MFTLGSLHPFKNIVFTLDLQIEVNFVLSVGYDYSLKEVRVFLDGFKASTYQCKGVWQSYQQKKLWVRSKTLPSNHYLPLMLFIWQTAFSKPLFKIFFKLSWDPLSTRKVYPSWQRLCLLIIDLSHSFYMMKWFLEHYFLLTEKHSKHPFTFLKFANRRSRIPRKNA